MCLANQKINKIISAILNDGEFVYNKIEENGFVYLDIRSRAPKSLVGGAGPVKINLKDYSYVRIHYLDYFPIIKSNEQGIHWNLEMLKESIKEKNYVSDDDFFNFLKLIYGEELTNEYSFYEHDEDHFGFEFTNSITKNTFIEFFQSLGMNVIQNGQDRILIARRIILSN